MALTQVKTSGITDLAVGTDQIAADAVTLAKMDGLARGKLIVGDSSGNPVALAAGSNDQVLTMDANGDVGWEAASAGATLSGSTNNTVVTVTGANAMQGEANLTYDGDNLKLSVDNPGEGVELVATGDHWTQWKGNSNRSSADTWLTSLSGQWNNTTVGQVAVLSGADTTNKDDGRIAFYTSVSDGNDPVERMRIDESGRVMINTTSAENADSMLTIAETSGHCEVNILAKNDSGAVLNFGDPQDYNIGRMKYDHAANEFQWDVNNTHRLSLESGGDLNIEDGNLKVAAGHGIDFSAQTATAASGASTSSEILDHYEEGTWTPNFRGYHGGNNAWQGWVWTTAPTVVGTYTRVGNTVTAHLKLSGFQSPNPAVMDYPSILGLPFSEATYQSQGGGCATSCNCFTNSAETNGYIAGTVQAFNWHCLVLATDGDNNPSMSTASARSFSATLVYKTNQ